MREAPEEAGGSQTASWRKHTWERSNPKELGKSQNPGRTPKGRAKSRVASRQVAGSATTWKALDCVPGPKQGHPPAQERSRQRT